MPDTHRPGFFLISEREVDLEGDVGVLVTDQMDGGEVEEDLDGHAKNGVWAGC